MPTITTKDNVTLYYKDQGTGQPVVFSHGWPLNSDAWEDQMFYLASKGYRVIAHDRRGHGRSEQPWNGNDMDTYADDLAQVIEKLDLKDAILVGHSTGGGEVARYVGRHGSKRVAAAVLIGAVTPGMLKTESNPNGLPMEIFDGIRASLTKDRAQAYKDFTEAFFGANRDGAKVSQGMKDTFWLLGMQSGLKATYDCVKAFSESEFTADLQKFDFPTLIIHGDDDQIVPIDITGRRTAEIVKGSKLVMLKGASHGCPVTEKDAVNAELFAFIEGLASAQKKSA